MPFLYPTSVEYRALEPELVVRGRAGRLGLDIMPIRPVNAAKVRWTQQDNYGGLQNFRGMDGNPTRISKVGFKTYEYEPGVFGEYEDITETELTTRAGSAPVDTTPIDVEDLIIDADSRLIGREFDRVESSIWAVLVSGTISIKIDGPNGTQVGYSDTYSTQTFTATTGWSTLNTSTPIRNFQSVQQMGPAHGVDFGGNAVAYMNAVTAQNMLNNTNAADLGGKRIENGGTINTLVDANRFLIGQNLPQIQIYDAGYLPSVGGTFTKFIPDNKVVVIGKRASGVRIGEYQVTRNASAGFRPESYRYVIDRANGINGEKRTPANIEVHRGHNGGPAILYPSAIVVMSV